MYQASVPVFTHMLNNLSDFLKKGEAHSEDLNIDPEVLINSRLYPNMFPLSRQIQIASDAAKGCGARLAGLEPPPYEDNEKSFSDLYERISRTIVFLNTLTPSQIDGSEEKMINLNLKNYKLTIKGMTFLLNFSMSHFYFHVTTAYDILRHKGVILAKEDFLGKPGEQMKG
jgi:hypothetical protein